MVDHAETKCSIDSLASFYIRHRWIILFRGTQKFLIRLINKGTTDCVYISEHNMKNTHLRDPKEAEIRALFLYTRVKWARARSQISLYSLCCLFFHFSPPQLASVSGLPCPPLCLLSAFSSPFLCFHSAKTIAAMRWYFTNWSQKSLSNISLVCYQQK